MIDWGSRIAAALEQAKDHARQLVANVGQLVPITSSPQDRHGYRVDGRPSGGAYTRGSRLMQHAGFRSRPPAQSDAYQVQVEGGANKTLILAEDDGQDVACDEGGAVLYAPALPDAQVALGSAGAVAVQAASGQDVTVNGGTAAVGRVGDAVDCGSLKVTVVGTGAITILYTPPGGVAATYTLGQPIPLVGKINAGAAHFKA